MSAFQAFFLGLIQGITEFLPVSSSGHLVIVPKLFGWGTQPLVFDTTLHLGTALALFVFFFKDIKSITLKFFVDLGSISRNPNRDTIMNITKSLWFKVLLGSIPAGILGILFESEIESYFRSTYSVAFFLLLGSLLMYWAQKDSTNKLDEPGLSKSIYIGIFQSLALLPGISRSGATISGGLLLGLKIDSAAKFSFLLSIPIVFLAGGFKLISSVGMFDPLLIKALLIGFFSSFFSGFFALSFMLRFVKKHGLNVFVFYRILLAIFLLLI